MPRRERGIDRHYKHSIVVRPIIPPRSNWQDDVITAETRAAAGQDVPVPSPVEPAPPAKPKRQRKPKLPPFTGQLAFNEEGVVIGWKVEGSDEIRPLDMRRRKKN